MNDSLLKRPPRTKTILTGVLLLLLFWGSVERTDATLLDLLIGIPQMWDLFVRMMPPDLRYLDNIFQPMLETIRMAVLGSTFGAMIAIPVSFLAASNVSRRPVLYYPARLILNLVRTIPDLLLASIFVAIFGLGAVPGVLALTFFSFGLISKLVYESIEAIDPGPLEAMTAVGANKIQWIHFGVVPQVLAQFMAYFLYTFEVNVRAAAVLGLVGAGGIGLYYDRTLGLLQYGKTSTIILFTLVIVLIIDYASTKIREKLL